MEAQATELAQFLVERLKLVPPPGRLLIGLAGIPASGKSTLSISIVEHTARLLTSGAGGSISQDSVILVGLDGWHLTRAQLDAMPDPKLAHDRRGIHWTFDAASYLSFIRALRQSDAVVVKAPTFDHALKDPTPDVVSIQAHHRIVLIEGLYTFLDEDVWREAGVMLDERWWIDIGIEEAQERLVRRHVETGVAKDMEEAIWRAEQNDMPNGRFIMDHLLEPTRRLKSVHEPALAPTV